MEWRKQLRRGIPMYIMILPGLLFFVIFKYVPMFGIIVAFKEYNPFAGFWGSEWVGLDHFVRLFSEVRFVTLLRNTLILSLLDILFYFPAPILLALMLNEVRLRWYKSAIQTIAYAPHFISWVVIVGITITLFSAQDGSVNIMLDRLGFDRIELMTDPAYFRPLWVIHNIWNGTGWGAIIFLAAMASIDPTLYESARVDGAGRFKQIWHITLPGIMNVVIILFILRLGNFMDIGFEHIYLLQNSLNMNVSDVFDTYVYRTGLLRGEFSYSTAVGLFKSLIGIVLVLGANRLAKKLGQEGVF
ncbi:ABC transporter permease [Paenibacillus sp. 1P07SE]|uniref:ABC transporter permease n=1 Tax=Paenibacillus sp. 1P07SE TaxID=3132209 RepID=UPI0039A75B5B